MKTTNAEKLLDKYNAGQASAEEIAIVERWYMETGMPHSVPDYSMLLEDQFQSRNKLISYMQPARKFNLWIPIASAAAILLIMGIWLFLPVIEKDAMVLTVKNVAEHSIPPGGNKAILILTNGKRIILTNATNGKLAEQAGMKISKTNDGQLVYKVTNAATATTAITYNTIETPNGGQYQVLLPDGTKVWLNAASSLRYPVNFASVNERKVELKGEAYFEVARDQKKPFIVKTDRQDVEVLGTHFNINSYGDEFATATTLLEGSIKVSSGAKSFVIKPGEQAQLKTNGHINIVSVDTEPEVAWKDGVFSFKRADLKMAMRQISRWYDVEVEYKGKVPEVSVTGKIHRNVTLQQALKTIGYLDVHFNVQGKKIIIESEPK